MRPGDIVAGRFRVERVAGKGGMGTVYRAVDRHDGRPVALKLLGSSPDLQPARFAREAQVLSRLDHPAIVTYVASGASAEGAYLAMEWLEGEDLARRLRRGSLTWSETRDFGIAVAAGLAAAHASGVIHRDLKPANLWLRDGDPGRPVILDFGIVRTHGRMTTTGTILGSPGYMAPEQARGEATIDAAADTFGLGCVLFECISGRPAFEGSSVLALIAKLLFEPSPSLGDVMPEAPLEFDSLIATMLARAPGERPTAPEVAAALAEISPGTRAPAPAARPRRGLSRDEQRFVCTVVAKSGEPVEPDTPTIAAPDRQPGELDDAGQGGELEVLGDGTIIASFRGASAPTDLASRAARCALILRTRAPEAAIAISTGRATGDLRASLSDAVARSEHMLSGVAPREIVVDDVAAALLARRFVLERDRLVAERPGLPVPGRLLGRSTPFVGRDRELSAIEAAIAECFADERSHGTLITAPAGAGKSRLLRELLEGATATTAATWMALGDPMTSGAPLGLVAQLLRDSLELRGAAAPEARSSLRSAVAKRIDPAEASRIASFFAEALGLGEKVPVRDDVRAARAAPQLMHDQVRRAWSDWVGAAVAERPLLLVIDDLHWGDLPSVDAIEQVLREHRDRPLFALALARPDVEELFPDLWRAHDIEHIRLRPLSPRACRRLAREVIGDRIDLDPLIKRAEGNAFFLEELLRTAAAGDSSPPASVVAMVDARLGRLEPALRQLLRAASVFGDRFWQSQVVELLGGEVSADELGPGLAELERREWLDRRDARSGDVELAFRHALLREAAYASLGDDDRALGHRLAAEQLEAAGEPAAVVIADHWYRGERPDRAGPRYLEAAAQAIQRNDPGAAIESSQRALTCPLDRASTGLARRLEAEAHGWVGRIDAMARSAEEASEALPDVHPEWPGATYMACWARMKLGDLEAACAHAAALARPLGKLELEAAIAVAKTAACMLQLNRTDLAGSLFARIERDRNDADVPPELQGAIAMARGHAPTAWLDDAVAMAEEAVRCFERVGDLRGALGATSNAIDALVEMGQFARASAHIDAALQANERLDLPRVASELEFKSGLVNLGLRRLGDAERNFEEAASGLSTSAGAARLARALRATALCERGELDAALALVSELLAGDRDEPAEWRARALAIRARVAAERGDPTAAASAHEALDELRRVYHQALNNLELWRDCARALASSGDSDGAARARAEAASRLERHASRIRDPEVRRTFLHTWTCRWLSESERDSLVDSE